MEEIWKDIKNYEGLYQISNLGRIKSLPRKNKRRNIKKEFIKSTSKIKKGYLRVGLSKNGVIKYYYPHRLVAEAFIPNPQNKPCVNHKDCNVKNNNANNLEWCTYIENNNYKNHNIKKHISLLIYNLKKKYPNEIELINNLENAKKKINNL